MSMRVHPQAAHLIPFTQAELEKLGLSDIAAPALAVLESGEVSPWEFDWDYCHGKAVLDAFKARFSILPYFVYIDDESDGLDGAAENGQIFLAFDNADKYTMTIKPEWEALPVEPVASTWCYFG